MGAFYESVLVPIRGRKTSGEDTDHIDLILRFIFTKQENWNM